MPENADVPGESAATVEPADAGLRIGVYTCYCGGNISDVVDCERGQGDGRQPEYRFPHQPVDVLRCGKNHHGKKGSIG
jgi:hypothetical protein